MLRLSYRCFDFLHLGLDDLG